MSATRRVPREARGVRAIYAPVRRSGRRWIASAVALAVLLLAGRSVALNPNFEWGVVARYLFSPTILSGVAVTFLLTLVVMGIGIALGTLLALGHAARNPLASFLCAAYIWFFRGTPVLVQLIFWYNMAALYPRYAIGMPFAEPILSGSVNDIITPWTAAVLALGLNEGAYMAEIVRAGLLSVDHGQREAARALGMRPWHLLRYVVLPQAMRAALPPTGNQTIGMLKGTSIVSIVALSDLLYSAQTVYTRTFQTIPLLMVACIWYLVMTTILTAAQSRVEAWFRRGDRALAATRATGRSALFR